MNLENISLRKRSLKFMTIKDHVLSDSIYVKCPKQQIYEDRKSIGGCLGLGEMGDLGGDG